MGEVGSYQPFDFRIGGGGLVRDEPDSTAALRVSLTKQFGLGMHTDNGSYDRLQLTLGGSLAQDDKFLLMAGEVGLRWDPESAAIGIDLFVDVGKLVNAPHQPASSGFSLAPGIRFPIACDIYGLEMSVLAHTDNAEAAAGRIFIGGYMNPLALLHRILFPSEHCGY